MLLLVGLMSGFMACAAQAKPATSKELAEIPEVPQEFRAAWVATVANIDWPTKPGLSTAQQKKELIGIMDKCAELNLNAVIFQVRTTADALYESDLEPWSYYITGKQGQAPKPYYDPLKMAVEEAHKRGMELHAWFNPYRSGHLNTCKKFDKSHINETNPDLVMKYSAFMWMDPGKEEVMKRSMDVFLDVAKRYDVDGIHIDDYFYPYHDAKDGDFPDADTYKAYKDKGGKLTKSDWRRDNVNKFIEKFYKELKKVKPSVKFGISPFGIWKPGYPSHVWGMNQYEAIFADAKLWFNKGWLDYFTPQLYWGIRNPDQSFISLLSWWESENTEGRHLWPGTALYKVGGKYDKKEIQRQVQWSRIIVKDAPGTVHFSMKSFVNNQGGLTDNLKSTVYKKKALVPESPWLKTKAPALPKAKISKITSKSVYVKLDAKYAKTAINWIIQVKRNGTWTYDILPSSERNAIVDLPGTKGKVEMVVVTAQGANATLSKKNVLALPKK
ncbi:family 10 glycosylhydrolase [Planctomycetota bacterium]|nr:family 10 glycosylhydrolase [Planctomycetota bacterium]